MADERIPRAAAEGFDRDADVYESARPSYPADAVERIMAVADLAPGRTVVDLGAGTGKLTRLLLGSGAQVVAVEPLAEMRRVLVEACGGGVDVLDGVAEDIPIADASVDAVTVAQAFHWFDPGAALAETARVLRPGGTLVLVWNTRDRAHAWVERFGEVLAEVVDERPYDSYYEVDYPGVIAEAGAGAFGDVAQWETTWSQPCDPELLVARAASVSVVAALDDGDRSLVLDRVRHLAATHPDLAGRPTFPFPYTTRIFSCRRR